MDRRRHSGSECGLCGSSGPLTKTHVPPQAAGNDHFVSRRHLVTADGRVGPGRSNSGGLWVYGLCADCNMLQSKYDAAYAELAVVLRPLWVRDWRLRLPERMAVPDVELDLGAVARSIVIGMHGIAPHIRTEYPDVSAALLDQADQVPLPGVMRLRLALCRGEWATILGPSGGMFLFGKRVHGRPVGVVALASVFFPPMAWQLASPESTLLDEQGWADTSPWLDMPTGARSRLSQHCPPLPAVAHPRQHPEQAEAWTEMFSEVTEIVETDRLPET